MITQASQTHKHADGGWESILQTTNGDGEHNSRRFSSRSARHGGDDKDVAGSGSGGRTFAPGSNSSPSGKGHHCSVHATAASSKARGIPASPAKGTLPEAQSEVGIG